MLARRNLISNATALVRATQGRGIVVSSEARSALACRGPWDVGNLAAGWGLGGERGREAVGREARGVVVRAEAMRGGWRGVVSVVDGGVREVAKGEGGATGKGKEKNGKRKAEVVEEGRAEEEKPLSKREVKRRAKRARLEAAGREAAPGDKVQGGSANEVPSETVSATQSTSPAERGSKAAAQTVSDKVGSK